MAFAPICVQCRREMQCKKNDYLFSDAEPACFVWAGDMFECQDCKAQVVVGFAAEPVAWSHEPEKWAAYRARRDLDLAG